MKTKKQKREEAEMRKAAFLRRTAKEQLALIEQRPGNSAAERQRIMDSDRVVIGKVKSDA